MTSSNARKVSSMVLFTFFLLWVSDAERKTAASTGGGGRARPRASSSRSSPFPLGTSARYWTPGRTGSRSTSSAESASAGIHFGETKLVASMRVRPASTSAASSASLPSVGTTRDSFWSPSRGPTS